MNVLVFWACAVISFIIYILLCYNIHSNFNNIISLLFRFLNILVVCFCWCCAVTVITILITVSCNYFRFLHLVVCASFVVIIFTVYNVLQQSQRREFCGDFCCSQKKGAVWHEKTRPIGVTTGMLLEAEEGDCLAWEDNGRWSDNRRAVWCVKTRAVGVTTRGLLHPGGEGCLVWEDKGRLSDRSQRKGGSGKSSWYQQEMGVEAKMFNGWCCVLAVKY